ncbi:MAG: ABC transporter ATP-binding protein [Anaerolineales bacterium]|nr:ABC transporter ATP-binding protein [Anaerolineae bacterium]PWB74864.1 MAG: ABC transporter ATP-binding protein [Anaerolineales bacterium]
MNAIQTNQLTRSFGALKAVDRLTLEIPRGTVFGFLGPNGSGKTTTIRLLLGLLDADQGSAQVLGFDTREQPDEVRVRCGALLEHHGLYERLSAAENLDYYGHIWHMSKADREKRIRELLEPLDLYERRDEPIGRWSRGMKQKLAVARTLMHRPELIFLDEPTAGLDPVASSALREDLSTLVAQEGVTIFLTTHNLAEAEKLCDRVGVINHGHLLAVGSPSDLRSKTSAPRLFVTGKDITSQIVEDVKNHPLVQRLQQQNGRLIVDLNDLTRSHEIVALLVRAGVQIDEVRKEKADLEDVFLQLVEEEKGGEE